MSEIDWGRVKYISVHLKEWMAKNDYELIDIERACAFISSKHNLPKSEVNKQ